MLELELLVGELLELEGGELVSAGGPWIKLDGTFWLDPKVIAAGNAGAGVYARALAYCGLHLSDGFVPIEAARIIGSSSERRRVTTARLWLEVAAGELLELLDGSTFVAPGDGYYVPDYCEHNRSRAEITATRKAREEGGREGARRRWGSSSEGGEGA